MHSQQLILFYTHSLIASAESAIKLQINQFCFHHLCYSAVWTTFKNSALLNLSLKVPGEIGELGLLNLNAEICIAPAYSLNMNSHSSVIKSCP